jgi:serine protease inhibitor
MSIASANNAFATDLYAALCVESGNLLFSPLSVYAALALAAAGAKGETAAEMANVLHFRRTDVAEDPAVHRPAAAGIHEGLSGLLRRLTDGDEAASAPIRTTIAELRSALDDIRATMRAAREAGEWSRRKEHVEREEELITRLEEAQAGIGPNELAIANALWAEQTSPFTPEFVATISNYYGPGALFTADFINDHSRECVRINQWVAERTRGRIEEIVSPLDPEQVMLMRLIIINAIYFKGEWQKPFEHQLTRPLTFVLADGGTVQVPMMQAPELDVGSYAAFNADGSPFDTPREIEVGQRAGLYPGDDGFAVLELPYRGFGTTMVFIAPRSPDGLPRIEQQLTIENLDAWMATLVRRPVEVKLPRFELRSRLPMADTLQRLGMTRAFRDPTEVAGADFTGMSASDDPHRQLYITEVVHEGFVEVNEQGTEASAATTVVMCYGLDEPSRIVPFTPVFRADRPFIFLIRHHSTGCVLFVGRVANPAV